MLYKVLEAISDSMKMHFPKTPAELNKVRMDFARLSHENIFSGCVGCVDGMLVRTITLSKKQTANQVDTNYDGSTLRHTGKQEDVAEFLGFYIEKICDALGCWSCFTSGYVSNVRTCLRDGCDARNEPNLLEREALSQQAIIALCILNRFTPTVRDALDAHLSMSENVFCDCSVPGCSNQRREQCKGPNPPSPSN